jgi:hypothetical protein
MAGMPSSMQETRKPAAQSHHFAVLGFTGNSAPDHIDHLHSMECFVRKLLKL